ncbi:MAG: hypothetical protein ACE5OZ_10120 [Candidatus Heimdallarchaeota archaeon]
MNVEAADSYAEQPKIIRFLDLSFAALVILTIAGGVIYLTLLEATIQNLYPVVLVAFFTGLTLYFRTKVMETPDDYERLQRLFRIWLLVALVSLVFGLFIILTYPI